MAPEIISQAQKEYRYPKDAYDNAAIISEAGMTGVFVLSFKRLQLLRIKALQQELFSLQLGLTLGGFTPKEYPSKLELLDSALRSYGKALKTYEILAQNTLTSIPEGYSLFGVPHELVERTENPSSKQGHTFLDYIKPRHRPSKTYYAVKDWTKYTHLTAGVAGGDYFLNNSLIYRELNDSGRRERAESQIATSRFLMGLFGGLTLMGPVLIMALCPGRNISLITTSIAVVLFALVLAFWVRSASGKDIWAATAAYAAVLVVFIGTSSPPVPIGTS